MSDSYLDSILALNTAVAYQAEYLSASITDKPLVGCVLPSLVNPTSELPTITSPATTKACVTPFIPYPLIPAPFALPENCPDGLTFINKTVSIYAEAGATDPAATLLVGASRSSGDFCSYELNIPDIIIPCFPGGPQITGNAQVTVVDPNSNTTETTALSINKSTDVACNWSLDGNVLINLPTIPCPSGVSFKSTSLNINKVSNGPVTAHLPVSIPKDSQKSCVFDISLPTLTIPCYPNGPKFNGNIAVNLTDQGNIVSSQNSAVKVNPGDACDFSLNSTIDLEVPCSTKGINANPPVTSWLINQPPIKDIYGTVIRDGTALAQTISNIKIARSTSDICNLVLNLPPITVPCSPDGINFIGAFQFTANGAPFTANTIDLTNNAGSLRNPDKSCEWRGTTIDLPMPVCSGGITYDAREFTIKLNSANEIKYTTTPTGSRYNTLQLVSNKDLHNNGDCGASLVGEINLGLPPFISACPNGLAVGGPSSYVKFTNGSTQPVTNTLTLEATTCGFGFSTAEINIAPILCPNGYNTTPSNFNIYQADGKTKVPNSLQLVSTQCGTSITGSLNLPAQAAPGSSFNYTPYVYGTSYPEGSSVSVVYPFGGKCIYKYQGSGNSPSLAIPGTPNGDGNWDPAASSGPKEFPPFKILRCNQWPYDLTIAGHSKMTSYGQLVKVFLKSRLYTGATSTNQLMHIYGLDKPFILAPGQKVWVEVVMNGGDPSTGAITPVYAAIATGAANDTSATSTTGVIVPSSNGSTYKTLTAAYAQAISTSGYLASSISTYVGLSSTEVTALTALQKAAISNIATRSNARPVQFKLYIPIAISVSEADNDYATADVVLSEHAYKSATAKPLISSDGKGTISSISIINPGYAYSAQPFVGVSSPQSGTNATATATLDSEGRISAINVVSGGSGYDATATVTIEADDSQIPVYYGVTQLLKNNQLLTGFNLNGLPILQNVNYDGKGSTADKLPILYYTSTQESDNYYTLHFGLTGASPVYTTSNGTKVAVISDPNSSYLTDPTIVKANVYVSTDGTSPTINTQENSNSISLTDVGDPETGFPYTYSIQITGTSHTLDFINVFAVCDITEPSPVLKIPLIDIVNNAT